MTWANILATPECATGEERTLELGGAVMLSYVMGPATDDQRRAMDTSALTVVVSPNVPPGVMLFVDDGEVVFRAVWIDGGDWRPIALPLWGAEKNWLE